MDIHGHRLATCIQSYSVISCFHLPDGDVNNSPIYQNPGWPIEDGASALELPN